jgi:transposase-like protein
MPELAIQTLPEAYDVINQMQLRSWEWSQECCEAGREAMAEVVTSRMTEVIDRILEEAERHGQADRRNGSYCRHLLTQLGDIELEVPRTRRASAASVVKAFARRTPQVERLILSCFLLGLSTRKVGEALLSVLGESVSATTVSRVAKTLDQAVAAFHRRRLHNRYRALVFDGVVLSRKTGAGAIKRPVLVALGVLPDGKKEVIDFRLAKAESETEWLRLLDDLHSRGLTSEGLEITIVDGGLGLLKALPQVYGDVPIQRCWAHKTRNITDKVRAADRESVKRGLRRIYQAATKRRAQSAARRFASRWQDTYPKAVACLRNDLDELLAFFHFKSDTWRRWTRTTNAIERRFREVRRRTRPMGAFQDKTSMERILFAVFIHENKQQGISPLFLVH